MSSRPGPPQPDLLVSGEDRPRRPWSAGRRRTAVVGVAVVLAAGAGVLVAQDRAQDERRRTAVASQDVVQLALLDRGQDGAPRYGPRRPGAHLVVANTGPATVRLRSGTLVPGEWQVDVPDRELRAGRSVVLEVRAPATCGTAEPRSLRVEARSPRGRRAVVAFDLAPAQLAYGGRLDDALAAAALSCDPTAPPDSDGRTYPHRSEVVRPSR